MPGKCTLLHKQGFWQNAKWDEEKTEHAAQVWMLGGQIAADRDSAHHTDLSLAALGNWTGRRYDFHWCIDQVPTALKLHREHQQDARQYTFQGLVGTHWEAQMGAQIEVLVVWELASRSVYRRNP